MTYTLWIFLTFSYFSSHSTASDCGCSIFRYVSPEQTPFLISKCICSFQW